MTIDVADVHHMAKLAELAVTDQDAQRLAAEMARIVAMVAQLDEVEGATDGEPVILGEQTVRLRDDVVAPIPMVRPPADNAPEMVAGLFVVPRLGGVGDA